MNGAGRRARAAEGALFAAAYVALHVLGRALLATWLAGLPWYPPAGLAVVYLAVRGWRGLPWMIAARLVVLLGTSGGTQPLTAVIDGTLATLLALAVASRLRRLVTPVGAAAWRRRDVAAFFALAIAAGAAFGLLAAMLAVAGGRASEGGFWPFALRYGIGDAVGIAVVVPLATLVWPRADGVSRAVVTRWAGIAVLSAAVGAMVEVIEVATGLRVFYLALLPLGWAAARHGVPGAAVAVAAFDAALTVTWALIGGAGTPITPITELQTFMLVAAPCALLIGAVTGSLDAELAQRRETEARLRAVVDQSVAGFYSIVDDRFVFANAHFASLLGYTPTDLLALPSAFATVAPEDSARVRASVARRLDGTERSAHHVFAARRKDGARVVLEAHAVATTIDGRRGVVGAVIDRTALATVEAELREREEQLRQAQKLEAVGLLAGGVAHDFNNMLTAIGANVAIAGQALDADDGSPVRDARDARDAVRESLGEIGDAAARAAALTRQLLAFGRKQVLNPRPVRLDEVVRATLPMVRRLVEADVRLDVRLDDAGTCIVDPTQIEQILLNLVVNARDATRDAAERLVAVRVHAAHVAARDAADRPGLAAGRYAVLEVSDAGIGMSDETRARIFEPFFTTKPPGEGTGLGLATVFGAVKQSGGAIYVDSAPDRGATFAVYLPAIDAPDDAPADAPADAPPADDPAADRPATARHTVLVVEDEDVVRRAVQRSLAAAGHTVFEAAEAADALRRWPELAERVTVVVTDMVMPGMDGLRLAAALRERRPDLHVVLMSGHSEARIADASPLPARTAWLAKPFTAQALRDALDAAGRPA